MKKYPVLFFVLAFFVCSPAFSYDSGFAIGFGVYSRLGNGLASYGPHWDMGGGFLQIGAHFSFEKFTVAALAEGGLGIGNIFYPEDLGVSSGLYIAWNAGGMVELQLLQKRLTLGAGGGIGPVLRPYARIFLGSYPGGDHIFKMGAFCDIYPSGGWSAALMFGWFFGG